MVKGYYTKVIKKCQECGVKFEVHKYREKIAKFCSCKCTGKNNGKKVTSEEMSRRVKKSWDSGIRKKSKVFIDGLAKTPERIIIRATKWAKDNPERRRKIQRIGNLKYRAKKKGNGGSITEKEWEEIKNKFDNKCVCCLKKKELEADHIIPISVGGSSNKENIQPLCRSCNAKKSNKIINYIKNYARIHI